MTDKREPNQQQFDALTDTQRLLEGVELPEDSGISLESILAEYGSHAAGEPSPSGDPSPAEAEVSGALPLPDETADLGAQPDSRAALSKRPASSRRLENNIMVR